jgi:hypothetical protein
MRTREQGKLSAQHRLFVAQGDHGIDSHGATRGNVSGDGGHQGESKRNDGERSGVIGRDAKRVCGPAGE